MALRGGEGKNLRQKYLVCGGKNGDGKGGKFLEKENCSCSAKGSPFLKRVGSLLESPK